MRDPGVISMPWKSDVEEATLARANPDGSAKPNRQFKFGMFWNDGEVTPQPPIARGLRTLHNLLKANGHTVSTVYAELGCTG